MILLMSFPRMPASCRIRPFLKSHPCFFALPTPLSSVGGGNRWDATRFNEAEQQVID